MLKLYYKLHQLGFKLFLFRLLQFIVSKLYGIMMRVLLLFDLKIYNVQLYKYRYFVDNFSIFLFDKERVTEMLKKFVKQFSNVPAPYLLLAKFQICTMQKEGYETIHQYQKKFNEYQIKKNINDINMEFISPSVFIGSLGNHWVLDSLIKANFLNLRKEKKIKVYLPKNVELRNPCLFGYFKDYVDILDDKQMTLKLHALKKSLTLELGFMLPLNDGALFLEIGDAYVQQKWVDEGRPPLLKLKESDRIEGERCLAQLGLPKNAWYVCLHVRQPGYRDGGAPSENFRNANPFTYIKAIKAITDQGGWVIRMGDPVSMTPLPAMERFVDYAHSPYRSALMDVFLCATCKFCVGTSSGVYNIARMFGSPVLLTNCLPIVGTYTLSSEHAVMPRLCRCIHTKRILSFRELYSPPVSMASSSESFSALGIEWIENSEDELEQAVIEMLNRLNGQLELSQRERTLQTKFKTLSKECGYLHGGMEVAVNAALPSYFLAKHANLLTDSTIMEE